MEAFRYGFRLWWRGCPKYLKKIGMGRPGSFDKENQHGGAMFALPGEFAMSGEQAAQVLWKCYKSKKFTYSQMRTVKKTLSYAYQLQGGVPGKNFETIPGVWLVVQKEQLKPQEFFCLPTKIPLPEELREAFTKEYNGNCGLCYMDWTRGLLTAWDWGVCGARSKEDLDRIKRGDAHGLDHAEGWGWTKFYGGRSKLCKATKGVRPWRTWRVCMCLGGTHKPLPEGAHTWVSQNGNLLLPPTWCTCCPVNAMDLLLRHQRRFATDEEPTYRHARIYRKWDASRRHATQLSEGEPVAFALRWLKAQGVNRDFDTNAGRKSLSRWLRKLEILHPESMQIHGDCEDVWGGSYQKDLPKVGYKERKQSLDPDTATLALRKFAWKLCKRGIPLAVRSTKLEKMMGAVLEGIGQAEKARKFMEDDSDEEL